MTGYLLRPPHLVAHRVGHFAEKSRILARTFAVNHGMKWLTLNFRESEAGDGTQRRDSSDWS